MNISVTVEVGESARQAVQVIASLLERILAQVAGPAPAMPAQPEAVSERKVEPAAPAPPLPSPALETPAPEPIPAPPPLPPPPAANRPLASLLPSVHPSTVAFGPERQAVLKREWPLGTSNDAIRAMLNALPGRPLGPEYNKRLSIEAARLGVRRPAAAPSVQAPPVPAPAPAPAPAVRDGPLEVDYATALAWGAQRGCDPHKLDLDAVNAKRAQHGLAPFRLQVRKAAAA